MKIKFTDASERFKIKVIELGRYAKPGEVIEVSDERFNVLSGNNRYHLVFAVAEVDGPKVLEIDEQPFNAEENERLIKEVKEKLETGEIPTEVKKQRKPHKKKTE